MGARRGALVIIACRVKTRDMLPYALVASRLTKAWLGRATESPVASESSCCAPEDLPAPYWYPPLAQMMSLLRESLVVPVASLNGVSKSAMGRISPRAPPTFGIGVKMGCAHMWTTQAGTRPVDHARHH